MAEFTEYFTLWNRLEAPHRQLILDSLVSRQIPRGAIVHNGSADCAGLIVVEEGQLRAYSLSEEGREITLYRLFPRDICLFSASCVMRGVDFEIVIQAEKDTRVWIIPSHVYRQVMETSAPAANYTNELMATRFSDVMWLMGQIMWQSMDRRIAAFLLEEAAIEGTNRLRLTHETIANHLGTHREVITRMLRYFQSEGMVALSRGAVELTDLEKLRALGQKS